MLLTWVSVVTFNLNERLAVDRLLSDLASGAPSPWRRAGETALERDYGSDSWRLEHFPLLAQGNVVAGAQLASLFRSRRRAPDFVVFYGCAGATDSQHTSSVFLVDSVNYLSLGTVQQHEGAELVTLKNKWLCFTEPPADEKPLDLLRFPLCAGTGPRNVAIDTGIPTARVAATDKVVRVGPHPVPARVVAGPPHDVYEKAEWTYGEALALVAGAGETLLVEMESYGVGRVAKALDILDSVVVMRVTTDSLKDHQNSHNNQRALLQEGRKALAHLLVSLFSPGTASP